MASTMTVNPNELIPHDEYHFYVKDHQGEARHIHLTPDIVSDMRELVREEHNRSTTKDWYSKFHLDIGDGIYL